MLYIYHFTLLCSRKKLVLRSHFTEYLIVLYFLFHWSEKRRSASRKSFVCPLFFIHSFIRSFILKYLLWTGPQTRLKRVFHGLQSSASSVDFQYSRFSSSCLLLHLHLPVTSIFPFIFLSMMCFRRQFLRKMWSIQLAFLLSYCI
jgi:hypothetical protein